MLVQSEAFAETKELLAHRFLDGVSKVVKAQRPDYSISFLYKKPAETVVGLSKAALNRAPSQALTTEEIEAI